VDSAGDDQESLTRRFNTTQGELTYAELADLIAPKLEALLDDIAAGNFAHRQLDDELIREFHLAILGDLVPDIAGAWRTEPVQIGAHEPPPHWQVPILMREYAANVDARISGLSLDDVDLIVESLAYAEGQILHIHPFADFNGRATRALLFEILCRLELPPLNTTVERGTDRFRAYVTALAAFDNGDQSRLEDFWFSRFEELGGED